MYTQILEYSTIKLVYVQNVLVLSINIQPTTAIQQPPDQCLVFQILSYCCVNRYQQFIIDFLQCTVTQSLVCCSAFCCITCVIYPCSYKIGTSNVPVHSSSIVNYTNGIHRAFDFISAKMGLLIQSLLKEKLNPIL